MCHFTLLISANDRCCADEWKSVPPVSDASISMSNGCRWSMYISEVRRVKHKPSYSVIYSGASTEPSVHLVYAKQVEVNSFC